MEEIDSKTILLKRNMSIIYALTENNKRFGTSDKKYCTSSAATSVLQHSNS